MVVVDHPHQVTWYDEAAGAEGCKIDVLVDIDVGDHRTGAWPKDRVDSIAERLIRPKIWNSVVFRPTRWSVRTREDSRSASASRENLRERSPSAGDHAAPRTLDGNRHRGQHGNLADRYRSCRSHRAAGRIVCADGPGVSTRGPGFRECHDGARHRRQCESRRVRHGRCRVQGVLHRRGGTVPKP